MLAAEIKERMAQQGGANWPRPEMLENAARFLNISPKSVKRAARVLRSGDENIIYLVRKGDLAVSAAAEKLAEKSAPKPAPSAPEGRFPIVHAAPRWERQKFEKLAACSVSEIAADDAVLLLWTPDHSLAGAAELIKRWGFRYQASIALWRKPRPGRYTRVQYDLVLIATRGRPPAPSSTPDALAAEALELTEIIEQMFPGLPHADVLRPRPATKG